MATTHLPPAYWLSFGLGLLMTSRTALAQERGGGAWQSGLSVGGEIRQRYEYFRNPGWGAGSVASDGSWLQRYMVHADVRVASRLRAFGEIKSGLESGRNGGPRPIDKDILDVHQAHVDLDVGGTSPRLIARIGRQELAFGSSRLVSVREGPTVRQSFDGVRLDLIAEVTRLAAFVTRPVDTRPGVLDDGRAPGHWFGGVYLASPRLLGPIGLDLYSLWFQRRDAEYDRGVADERRVSLGTRVFGNRGAWDWNVEAVYQVGDFGGAPIRAWTVASDTGVRAARWPGRPRLGLRADVASGDRRGRALGTFNAKFPRGSYFGEESLFGPSNFRDLHPSLSVDPAPELSLAVDWDVLWRHSTRDALYNVGAEPRIAGQSSAQRFIGSHTAASVEWRPVRRITLTVYYGRFFAGPFLAEAGRRHDIDFLSTSVTGRF